MKQIVLILALFFSVYTGYCQQSAPQEDMVLVPRSAVPSSVLAELDKKAAINDTRNYIGLGKEIGAAVKETLSAVSSESNAFADTPVGKLTVAMVVYKILGKDVIRILIFPVIVVAAIGVCLHFRSCRYRKTYRTDDKGKSILVSKEIYGDTSTYDGFAAVLPIIMIGVGIILLLV